jgi:long-chain acyl-CoA synthetase
MTFKRSWNGVYAKPDNLAESFAIAVQKFASNRLFGTKNAAGEYEWVTYAEVGKRVDAVRGGLAKLGIKKGDKVGVISANRTEWAVCSYATYGLGAAYVPMYEKELTSMWKYILKDASIKVLFVSTPEIHSQIEQIRTDLPALEHIILFDNNKGGENTLSALEQAGKSNPVAPYYPKPEEIAVLIYTSGTTGDPKGVLLSHGNCTSCSQSGYHLYQELNANSISFSHLPWAHSYGFSAELNNWIQFGGAIGLMDTMDTLAADLAKVAPTYLISVPRIFNKIYTKIFATMKEEGGLKAKLFHQALAEAEKKRKTGKGSVKYKLLDKAVFGKIRKMFGGRLQGALTASAKMNPDVAQFFFDIGIPVYDCYGMTETSPAVTMSHATQYRSGTVGKVLENIDIIIDKSRVGDGSDDGEIIVYGPNVMQGYYNKPEKTKEVMTPDGGIRTGDRGRLDEDGFLWITGRFKEEYKLENGKYVFPAEIEEDMKLLPYVGNVMIYGDGKPYNVALIYPNLPVIEQIADHLALSISPQEALKNPKVVELLTLEIGNHLKKRFGGYEIPKKIAFVDQDFTVENGMGTQTLKVKRTAVYKKFADIIEKLYQN